MIGLANPGFIPYFSNDMTTLAIPYGFVLVSLGFQDRLNSSMSIASLFLRGEIQVVGTQSYSLL